MNICHSRSTAVRGRRRSSSQSPPRGPFCRTRTGPVEADGAVDAQNAPTAPWKTLCVFHELPQGLSHQVTHEKLRKAPKYRWETRIDPIFQDSRPSIKKLKFHQDMDWHCQVDEKLVDRSPRYWAQARRDPAMLGIRNGRQAQLDNTCRMSTRRHGKRRRSSIWMPGS